MFSITVWALIYSTSKLSTCMITYSQYLSPTGIYSRGTDVTANELRTDSDLGLALALVLFTPYMYLSTADCIQMSASAQHV